MKLNLLKNKKAEIEQLVIYLKWIALAIILGTAVIFLLKRAGVW